jgi:hypothetical protein
MSTDDFIPFQNILLVPVLVCVQLLDVRENKVGSIAEIASIANKLEKLEVLAAIDNPFSLAASGPKVISKYRTTFISMVPKLKKVLVPFVIFIIVSH